MQETVTAPFCELASVEFVAFLACGVPQMQQGEYIAAVVDETSMRVVGGFLFLTRTLPRILYGQGGSDDGGLEQATFVVACQHDAPESGVHRQLGQRTAGVGQPIAASVASFRYRWRLHGV